VVFSDSIRWIGPRAKAAEDFSDQSSASVGFTGNGADPSDPDLGYGALRTWQLVEAIDVAVFAAGAEDGD